MSGVYGRLAGQGIAGLALWFAVTAAAHAVAVEVDAGPGIDAVADAGTGVPNQDADNLALANAGNGVTAGIPGGTALATATTDVVGGSATAEARAYAGYGGSAADSGDAAATATAMNGDGSAIATIGINAFGPPPSGGAGDEISPGGAGGDAFGSAYAESTDGTATVSARSAGGNGGDTTGATPGNGGAVSTMVTALAHGVGGAAINATSTGGAGGSAGDGDANGFRHRGLQTMNGGRPKRPRGLCSGEFRRRTGEATAQERYFFLNFSIRPAPMQRSLLPSASVPGRCHWT